MTLRDWRPGHPWSLNFPEKVVGRVGIALDPLAMDRTRFANLKNAMGPVVLPQAAPLLFSTPLVYIHTDDLFRFRPDEIEQLQLSASEPSDHTLQVVADYFKGLQGLHLDNCWNMTDNCMDSIARMHKLVFLHLQAPWTDMDVRRLGQVVSNSHIKLLCCEFVEKSDDLCRALCSAKNLTGLAFAKCE